MAEQDFCAWCLPLCVAGVFSLGAFLAPICTRTLASSGNVSNNLTAPCVSAQSRRAKMKNVFALYGDDTNALCVRLGGELPLFPTCVHYLMSPTRFPFAPPCTCMMCNVMQYSTAPIKLELEHFRN